MALDLEFLTEQWDEFLSTTLKKKVNELLATYRYPDKVSIFVDYQEIQNFSPELLEYLEKRPDEVLLAGKQALKQKGISTIKDFEPNIRITGMPDKGLLIQNIKAENIDGLITFKGVITKRTEIMHRVERAVLRCSLCQTTYKFLVTKNTQLPTKCENCKKPTLEIDEELSGFTDLQKAEAQELLERVRGGTPAARIELVFEGDLVNTINPGDNVQVTGIMRIRPIYNMKKGGQKTSNYTKYIDVVNFTNTQKDFEEIEISDEDERKILQLAKEPNVVSRLIKSVAPMIYGHDEVKEAITLQMFGGTQDKEIQGTKMRNDIHILLIGDPGTAKTRFLQQVEQIAPKCIFVSGKSVTGVGLTASAERDELSDGGWTLKAGALVLASGGSACIDEFDKIDETERAAMHEVMESQSVSVAKAGIVAKFKAKTAILAAANPKRGRFDPNKPPAEQFDIPPTILSRFDLIFPVLDIMDEEKDAKLADFILRSHQLGAEYSATGKYDSSETDPEIIEPELLKKYVAYMRKHIKPILSQEAKKAIRDYYVQLRKIGKQQGAVPITARQIEGLIRLSEASAKMRMSNIVEEQDANRAIKLMDFVLNRILTDKETGRIDIDLVAVGKPRSQQEKYDIIMSIARKLQKENGEAELRLLYEIASNEYNIEESLARRIVDDLINKSELYKVRNGYVKIVEQE